MDISQIKKLVRKTIAQSTCLYQISEYCIIYGGLLRFLVGEVCRTKEPVPFERILEAISSGEVGDIDLTIKGAGDLRRFVPLMELFHRHGAIIERIGRDYSGIVETGRNWEDKEVPIFKWPLWEETAKDYFGHYAIWINFKKCDKPVRFELTFLQNCRPKDSGHFEDFTCNILTYSRRWWHRLHAFEGLYDLETAIKHIQEKVLHPAFVRESALHQDKIFDCGGEYHSPYIRRRFAMRMLKICLRRSKLKRRGFVEPPEVKDFFRRLYRHAIACVKAGYVEKVLLSHVNGPTRKRITSDRPMVLKSKYLGRIMTLKDVVAGQRLFLIAHKKQKDSIFHETRFPRLLARVILSHLKSF